MAIVDVLIKLRALNDPTFKVDFHVDFSSIELIARDVICIFLSKQMNQIKEYDFEIVVFRIANCYFTTRALFYKLQETVFLSAHHFNYRTFFY